MIRNGNLSYYFSHINISKMSPFFSSHFTISEIGMCLESMPSLNFYQPGGSQPGGSHDTIVITVQTGHNCSQCHHFD